MAMQFSTAYRNAMLDQFETTVGLSPVLKMFTGAAPANCAAANTGTELVSMTLPSDWLGAAAAGVKSKAGTWSSTGITAGSAGHFRIYASDGTTCHDQGTITASAGGGDMTLDNISIAAAQVVTVSTYALTAPGA